MACFAVIAVFFFIESLAAQSIPYRNYPFSPGNTSQQPPADALSLLTSSGGVAGKVWLEQLKDGIVVNGAVTGASPRWARFPLELPRRGHVNIWLSLTDTVPMPNIGWGNQQGFRGCESYVPPDSPRPGDEDCATWSARQVQYRDQLRRLFVREWQLAPNVLSERFATEGYRQALGFARSFEEEPLRKLEPAGSPSFQSYAFGGSYVFQAFVPWNAFPAARALDISRIYFVAEVADGETTIASTSPSRNAGDPATFKQLPLGQVVTSRIGRCEAPLKGKNLFEKELQAWYLPGRTAGTIAETFVLSNAAAAYRWDPEGLSPVPVWTPHFSKDLGGGNVVCGPELRYSSGTKVFEIDGTMDQKHLSSRKMPDGSYLLKAGTRVGSYSPLGSGMCGACPTFRLWVYHLDPLNGSTLAFQQEIRIDAARTSDADIQFSPDWRTITVFEAGGEGWSSTKYCLNASYTYEHCGSGPAGRPKARQVLKED